MSTEMNLMNTHTAQHPNLMIAVLTWELKRLGVNRLNWGLAGVILLLCLALMWFKSSWGRPVTDGAVGETVLIVGTSAIGLPYLIIFSVLSIFGLAIPFMATEAVARDYKQRTHELLMTTSLSAPIYVFGRFMAMVIISLGLACLLLAAIAGMTLFLHFTEGGYPMPSLELILAVWAVAVVPATIVLCGVSFALGTWFPRRTNAVKALVLSGWVLLTFMADVFDHGGTWFTYWSPTSYGIVRVNVDRFLREYQIAIKGISDLSVHANIALQLQGHVPDLTPWVLPHLLLVFLSFGFVIAIAAKFRRFRDVLN